MTKKTRKPGERPTNLKPPKHLSENKPVPEPDPLEKAETLADKDGPTRYGDWEHKGIAVDF